MSVPSRDQSAELILSLQPPAWHLRHSRAVAETAAWLALRAAEAGRSVDRRLVEVAALLHDIDKLERVRADVAELGHGDAAAEWLARNGWPELGPVIAGHPVTRLADAAWFEEWLGCATAEALIVSYADKRAGQRLESMADRFASWERRYPPSERATRARGTWTPETLAAVRGRAAEIERRVCELAVVAPGDVRRLAWTSRALAAARAAVPATPAVPAALSVPAASSVPATVTSSTRRPS
jgi:putative nucleotidyltransferase with HDIG domain